METVKPTPGGSRGSQQPTRPRDYSRWSVEELRRFAAQLRVPNAASKNRGELLELFEPKPVRAAQAEATAPDTRRPS